MGLLSNLFSKLLGSGDKRQSGEPIHARLEDVLDRKTLELVRDARKLRASIEDASASGLSMTISYSGPSQPAISISETEISEAVAPYDFVINNEIGPLKASEQWFEEVTQKRHLREGPEQAYAWLIPFLPLQLARLEQLKPILELGPKSAAGLAKTLRALIRERRKAKQAYDDLLRALYGSCVLADFSKSLAFDGMPVHSYVDIRELQGISVDYSTMGYQCIEALSKTDVKWLVEAFGEPAEHRSFDTAWPQLRRNAISRYCWEELRSANATSRSFGLAQKTINEWLRERIARYLGYRKEWQQRRADSKVQLAELAVEVEAAWAATRVPFAVADLETTGLDAESAEILEFAAVLVEPDGSVASEFSMLVRPQNPIPAEITQITGITQADVDAHGQPLALALAAFLKHIGNRPLFFHNAPFDTAFIGAATARNKLNFKNSVHDTLPIARRAWPTLGIYKLGVLAAHIGAAVPTHRALGDAHAALAVLLAARKRAT